LICNFRFLNRLFCYFLHYFFNFIDWIFQVLDLD